MASVDLVVPVVIAGLVLVYLVGAFTWMQILARQTAARAHLRGEPAEEVNYLPAVVGGLAWPLTVIVVVITGAYKLMSSSGSPSGNSTRKRRRSSTTDHWRTSRAQPDEPA